MVGRGGIYGNMYGDGQMVSAPRDEDWRKRAAVAMKCPYGPHHGGCHYPDCAVNCAGRPVEEREKLTAEFQQAAKD